METIIIERNTNKGIETSFVSVNGDNIENGCLYNKTDYITKNEMNQFLRGYLFAKENKL